MNDANSVSSALNTMWASIIRRIEVDLPNHRIMLTLETQTAAGKIHEHRLVFEEVSSFFFANAEGERRFNLAAWESAELSEAYFFADPQDHILHKSDKPGTECYESDPNFYLEIWDSALMIEAGAISLDGQVYRAR